MTSNTEKSSQILKEEIQRLEEQGISGHILEELMELDEGTLKSETLLSNIEEWDSVAFLSFIAMMDDEFGKMVKGSLVREQKTVADLMALMEK